MVNVDWVQQSVKKFAAQFENLSEPLLFIAVKYLEYR